MATEPQRPEPIVEPYFLPIYCVAGATAAIVFIGVVAPRGPNSGLIRTCITMSAVCMFMFWLVVYMAQMNPIMCPKMPNSSLAWMSVKWGAEAPKGQE